MYCAPKLISMTLLLIKEEMISLASAEYVAVYIRPGARYYIASVSSFVYQLSSNPKKTLVVSDIYKNGLFS